MDINFDFVEKSVLKILDLNLAKLITTNCTGEIYRDNNAFSKLTDVVHEDFVNLLENGLCISQWYEAVANSIAHNKPILDAIFDLDDQGAIVNGKDFKLIFTTVNDLLNRAIVANSFFNDDSINIDSIIENYKSATADLRQRLNK